MDANSHQSGSVFKANQHAGLVATMFLLNAKAAPEEIDLIGLRMGQSVLSDVERVGVRQMPQFDDSWYLTIGGHRMLCLVFLIEGKLSAVRCKTGEESGRRYTEATNQYVHNELKSGYLKKLGKPENDESEEVQNRMGAVFTKNSVTWIDKMGTILSITNMSSTISSGSLTFLSEAQMKKSRDDRAKRDAEKKF